MKKLSVFFLFVFCSVAAQDVKFTAKIANRNSDQLTISAEPNFKKQIAVNQQGIFEASFDAPAGLYQMTDGTEFTSLYLEPGYDITLTMDAKQFDESIVYKGKGEKENNFLAKKTLMEEEFQNEIPKMKSQAEFNQAMATFNAKIVEKLNAKGLDPDFKAAMEKAMKAEADAIAAQTAAAEAKEKAKQKLTGTMAPSFDYENAKGGKTKLADFAGKYVYIDIWATWCGPCRAEIPFLQTAEEKYHDKNIEFVSISVDVDKDHDKWVAFVKDKQLGGTQLFADKNWNSDFITAFGINSIPRFILIDPNGKIVNADALRPSNPSLITLLDQLLVK